MPIETQTQLTEQALKSRLLRDTTNHPVTLSSGVLSVLGGVGATLFASSDAFIALAAISGLGLAACIGFLLTKTVFGKHQAMLAIIEKVRRETVTRRLQIAQSVEAELTLFNDQHGLRQLSQLQKKFNAFEAVLNHQFDKDEFTHKRYLTSAEQLLFGAVDNLKSVAMLWHSTSAIDADHLMQQLADPGLDPAVATSLKQRLAIYQQSQANRTQVLAINEQVMTKLDELTNKLGSIQTREGLGEVSLDTAMHEIMHLIGRTEQYDIRKQH